MYANRYSSYYLGERDNDPGLRVYVSDSLELFLHGGLFAPPLVVFLFAGSDGIPTIAEDKANFYPLEWLLKTFGTPKGFDPDKVRVNVLAAHAREQAAQ